MKRKKTVYVKYSDGDKISVTIESVSHGLMRDEAGRLINSLASDIMRCIEKTPYNSAYLCNIKVK